MCRFTIEKACWRSWLERGATSAKVAGSETCMGHFFLFLITASVLIFYGPDITKTISIFKPESFQFQVTNAIWLQGNVQTNKTYSKKVESTIF
jgi:hypothetical protein